MLASFDMAGSKNNMPNREYLPKLIVDFANYHEAKQVNLILQDATKISKNIQLVSDLPKKISCQVNSNITSPHQRQLIVFPTYSESVMGLELWSFYSDDVYLLHSDFIPKITEMEIDLTVNSSVYIFNSTVSEDFDIFELYQINPNTSVRINYFSKWSFIFGLDVPDDIPDKLDRRSDLSEAHLHITLAAYSPLSNNFDNHELKL